MSASPPPTDRELLGLLNEVSSALRCCRQDVFCCEGLNFSQFVILDMAAGQPSLPLNDLHQLLSVDKSTTTRLVAPMVKRGLVSRKKSADDGRAASLAITPAGRETLAKVWECVSGFLGQVQANIPARKRAAVLSGLREFVTALRGAWPQQVAPIEDLSK